MSNPVTRATASGTESRALKEETWPLSMHTPNVCGLFSRPSR
jgi:hypothetical protein